MVVLPRFLYLFQMIPIFLPKSVFKELGSLISSFLWNKSVPRMRNIFLEMPKAAGGMGLPNFMYYYWAANISKLIYWIFAWRDNPGPAWADMELRGDSGLCPISLMSAPISMQRFSRLLNPVVKHSLKIWLQFRKHFRINQLSLFSPLLNNHLFLPSQTDAAFQTWQNNGLIFIKDLFAEGTLLTFELLQKSYNIPKSNFYRFLQIRSFVSKHFRSLHSPANSPADEILALNPFMRGNISKLYTLIQNIYSPSWEKTKVAWEQDLNIVVTGESWQQCLEATHTSSVCIRQCLIQFKVLHRLHYSLDKLAKMFPNTSSECLRCHQGPATLGHMFWNSALIQPSCPKVWCVVNGVDEVNSTNAPTILQAQTIKTNYSNRSMRL
uniref:Reverse transcriptase zinc-binding domain-containing protein n=1 Tax=Denticeps clupeoides TaxID=299321 RepID=A0AAY4CMV8_9TELE